MMPISRSYDLRGDRGSKKEKKKPKKEKLDKGIQRRESVITSTGPTRTSEPVPERTDRERDTGSANQ